MAVCNILGELKDNIGTFLTFSQYMEDLTKWNVNSSYKVVPSRFVAMNIENVEGYTNKSISENLTIEFENACALFRRESGWNPIWFKDLFWQSLSDMELVGEGFEEIKYIGDINIQSYDEHDGVGYSEIYCYIPNNTKESKYEVNKVSLSSIKTALSGSYLEGFDGEDDYKIDVTSYEYKYNYSFREGKETKNSYFNINSIVVLYDIIGRDGEKIYEDIPMGIYFTGGIDGISIKNSITIYSNSEEIYDAGTSYGLRICSRFVVSNGTTHAEVVEDNNYSDLTQVLSQISISQNKMDDILNKTYNMSQNYKDLLAIFKNSRTNVPYIKNINGVNYWFVNGRMLQPASYDTSNGECGNCLELQASIDDNIILCTEESDNYYKQISWRAIRGGADTQVDELYLNNEKLLDYSGLIDIEVEHYNSPCTIDYNVKVKVDDMIVEKTPYIKFVYPSYWGLVDKEPTNIDGLEILKLESKKLVKTYTNIGLKHVCFIYPKYEGELTSIKDARDIEYINDFKHSEVIFNNIEYHMYIDITPADVVNYTLKFS